MHPFRILRLSCLLFPLLSLSLAAESLNLAGDWIYHLDSRPHPTPPLEPILGPSGTCQLPGTLPLQGIGEKVDLNTPWTGDIIDRSFFTAPAFAPYRQPGNFKVPFWLQPEVVFAGRASFERTVRVPEAWAGKRLELFLERPHGVTRVWLNGKLLGSDASLSTPHRYEAGIASGGDSLSFIIEVDNRLTTDIGVNSHSISDHTQGNWNGIVGAVELRATPTAWIRDLQVYPDLSRDTIRVEGQLWLISTGQLPSHVDLSLSTPTATKPRRLSVQPRTDGTFSGVYPIEHDDPRWDEFSPNLLTLRAEAAGGDERTVRFGLREFTEKGNQWFLNGRPLFLRGTLDCAAYPKTGHPPMEKATWAGVFATLKAHGLNHVRMHSWCPPEVAFEAADEAGLYLQIEMASWPNQSTTLGDGKPVDAWLRAETARILSTYGNHPSFLFCCCCNEPGGDKASAWLADWVSSGRAKDPRHVYTSGAGWPELAENQYHVTPEPRIQHWGEGLKSRINLLPPETVTDYRTFTDARQVPVVSHEIGQWCVYPNLEEIPKYTGYLKPRNFEIVRDSLAAHGLLGQAQDFLVASGKLQALCYKEEIEAALRTPHMGGFQLLGLSDFPGQGTALVGVLDPFWESKPYITPEEFRRFCGPTIPLARLGKRVYDTSESLVADLEVAHFGAAPLNDVTPLVSLLDDQGKVVAHEALASTRVALGNGQRLGHVNFKLQNLPAPAHYRLTLSLGAAGPSNDWDVWVYPTHNDTPAAKDLLETSAWDATALARLRAGGSVLLTLPRDRVASDPKRGHVALGFSSIFWNTAWTSGQAPHTLGVLCDPTHPALANFPTESHSNWQWWYVVSHAEVMTLDALPAGVKPVVQVVDDWTKNQKLALAFEARVGNGKLFVTSIDFGGAPADPVRRQLLDSFRRYAASEAFQPNVQVPEDGIAGLLSR